MKKKIIYFLMILLAIILQTSVLPIVFRSSIPGDLVLMLVLAGVVLDGFFAYFWWAIFAGILYDLATFVQVGTHALVFLLSIYFVSFFSRRFSVEVKGVGILLFALFVVSSTIISRAVVSLSLSWEAQAFLKYFEFFGNPSMLFFQVIWNLILFFICFYFLKKVKNFFDID
ncbi:MAG: hypothetical protein ACD_8C00133G0018 [uncultured bacterium]|nr:MAG: hypothetical protein ACD_8C00133G0018 [uncultured bacterium]